MSTTALTNAPKTVQDLYWHHFEECRDKGKSEPDARHYALRMIRLAGWCQMGKKWQQLAPDVRDRVNVREAFVQPDGTYVIPDVDVFYPNAVKGGDGAEAYTPDDVRSAIRNTNASIASGGWRPPLTEGHNPMGDMVSDSQADAHGFGVNWRESPRGDGWARCDLEGVSPDHVQRMRDRKLPGLSARMAKDAGKLNRRFGHIAMLGGTPPALSRLPLLEIYSANNQVCFSAEADTFTGVPFMERDQAKKMAECFSALGAAYASYASGEEGADSKLHEAHAANLKSLREHLGDKSFNAYLDPEPGAAGGGNPHANALPGEGTEEFAAGPDGASDGSDQTDLAEATLEPHGDVAGAKGDFSSTDPQNPLAKRLDAMVKKIDHLTKLNAAFAGKQARMDFSAECDGLRKQGYQLPDQKELEASWQDCFASGNPKSALANFSKLLRNFPRISSPADAGQVFSAGDAEPAKAQKEESLEDMLRDISNATGRSYSAEDVKIGAMFSRSLGLR